MRKEYQVVYDYRGYQIPVGNPCWIPDRETAQRIMENRQGDRIFRVHKLYLTERETDKPLNLKPNGEFNGKPVYNPDTLWWDAMRPGDLVDQEVADNIYNALPPVCARADCLQLGEPQSSRFDEEKGKWRTTYLTLKRIAPGVYEYCGDCFRGENVQRGREMSYV